MKIRHWLTIACLACAGAILWVRSEGTGQWTGPMWDGLYWASLLTALLAVVRGRLDRRSRR